jgi:hypothetical protein
MVSHLGIGAVLDSSDEIDDIASPTGSETVPESSAEVGAESGRVVTAVEGTGAEELISPAFELGIETIERKDPANWDLCLEMPKRSSARNHFCSQPRWCELCGFGALSWRRFR